MTARGIPAAMLLLAAGGEEAGPATFAGISLGVWQALNLASFLVLLVWLLRKPVRTFFTQRQEGVAAALRKAEEDRARAEAIATELSDRLGRLEGELAEVRAHAARQAEVERAEAARQAEEEARRIVARAAVEMETRARTARTELTRYAAELAVSLARDLLKAHLTDADQERLVKDGLVRLEQPRAEGRPS